MASFLCNNLLSWSRWPIDMFIPRSHVGCWLFYKSVLLLVLGLILLEMDK